MEGWKLVGDLVAALGAAFVFGAIFEKLGLGAIVGYLAAGVVVGPHALGLVSGEKEVAIIAELGIALVMFTVGLEFSWLRLKRLGRGVILAGAFQVLVCIAVFTALGVSFGLGWKEAMAASAVLSVSSTAIILRVLRDRGDLDSAHGKVSFGILIIQDVALIPLAVMVSLLGKGGGAGFSLAQFLPGVATFLAGAGVFYALIAWVAPRAFQSRALAANRELPVILALVVCGGSAYAAHSVGISSALGSFVAGVILAETPFEGQIRADMSPFKAVFGTVFFLSVGMVADLAWISANWPLALGAALAIPLVKTAANYVAIRTFKRVTTTSAASAMILAQVGELGFLLIQAGVVSGALTSPTANLLTAVAVITMMASPVGVPLAPMAAKWLSRRLVKPRKLVVEAKAEESEAYHGHFVVVGFGTAGRTAVRVLGEARYSVVALDMDPKFIDSARANGAVPVVGDATRPEILEHLRLNDARAMIFAIPDTRAASLAIACARRLAPDLVIVARSRHHSLHEDLIAAGATLAIGEEELLGRRLGEEAATLALGHEDRELAERR
jgi:monovalent cation:H+ antiporter-2, CPA2 family